MPGQVCVVIVNYRTAALAVDCLHSLAAQRAQAPALRVVVVDNDSGDGSQAVLEDAVRRQAWSDWIRVVPGGRNGGFAFGNNVGIREALRIAPHCEYLWLLNPDTVARDGALRALVEFMDQQPQVGIAGSLLENPGGGTDCSAHRAPSPLGELESGARLGIVSRLLHRYRVSAPVRSERHACDWVSGASLMLRRAALDAVGGLDEGFFLYFEEVDFCLRAQRAGWDTWFVPASRVLHREGSATGIAETARRRPRYWFESRRRYFVKHHGVAGLIAADVLWAAGRLLFALRRLAGRRDDARRDPLRFASDLLLGDLQALLTGRIRPIRMERSPP